MIRQIVFRTPDLDVVSSAAPIPRPGEPVRGKTIGGGVWRRAELDNSAVFSSLFINAHLEATRFDAVTLDTCLLTGCTFTKAVWNGAILKDVIFYQCQFDDAVLTDLRAVGPVAFLDCNFDNARFAGCNLRSAIFDRCSLTATAFHTSHLQGCDLRGNDLSAIVGAATLRGATISTAQVAQLGRALTAELGVALDDTEPGPADVPGLITRSDDDPGPEFGAGRHRGD